MLTEDDGELDQISSSVWHGSTLLALRISLTDTGKKELIPLLKQLFFFAFFFFF